ncbi:hypothetical protein WICPIJ_008851 [Wickerhamomyces pijperi]|uniref:Uncharacterized protein n=1 Tax=Wickerhamomyces pijperi TaxID=599730 RepID=A0A9P8TGS4_WICPI|nr:hypothetical protein WICPIJ_008851 [Wickerhamomyces pijperi]
MPYRTPIGGVTRQYNKDIVTHSCEFGILNEYFQIGARTALIKIPGTSKVVVWSSIPPSPELTAALETSDKNFEVSAIIIPDALHYLAAKSMKELYPSALVIGSKGVKSTALDLTVDLPNDVTTGEALSPLLKDFEFVRLPGHRSNELVTFYRPTKTVLAADLMFNVPYDGINEQYHGSLQTRGFMGYLLCHLNPDGFMGKFISKRLFPDTKGNREGLNSILNWDFDNYILSHGVNLENGDAKDALRRNYAEYLK